MGLSKKDRAEVRKVVLDKHPVSKAEGKCEEEKRIMNNVRANAAKKIIDLGKMKKIYE